MDVLDELRVGEKVSEGRFRIDQKRALEKLKKNRLAEPEGWIREVLRAAHASHAKKVSVRTDADDVDLTFDGRPFPAAVMKHLLAQALGGDDEKADPRHRLLALGVAGAMGLGLQRLVAKSGKVTLELDGKGEVHLREHEAHDGTVLKVRKQLNLRVLAAWFGGRAAEARIVASTRHGYGPQLVLDGREVKPLELPPKLHDAGGLTVHARVRTGEQPFSAVQLYVFGVLAGFRSWTLPGAQLEAHVFCDAMRLNASGSNIVDSDPNLGLALSVCRRLSLEVLREAVKDPTPSMREQVAQRLLDDQGLEAEARAVMRTLPLFPGPAGERWSLEQLEAQAKNGPLYTSHRRYPKGSCPEPTVLLDWETARWEKLLPEGAREDVAQLVLRNQRAAENKAAWEAQPAEAHVLGEGPWLGTADLATRRLKGQLGLPTRGDGAWVRLLARGRFLQEGELPQLSPLRLRAVVDLTGPISEKVWTEIPNPRLWSDVTDELEAAAEDAICAALRSQQAASAAHEHARALLARRAGVAVAKLPPALRAAPLFEALGGAWCSLDDLEDEKRWRYVPRRYPHPPLDGGRVLVLDVATRQLLEPFSKKRLENVSDPLDDELLIRKRLEGPKQQPGLPRKTVSVTFEQDGVRGEVGISVSPADKLELTLLRDGFELETTSLTPRYGPTVASVESPALNPTSDWKKAMRDARFDEVVRTVHEQEPRLAAALLAQHRTFTLMPLVARGWLLAFVKKELTGHGTPSAAAKAVLEAPMLDGPTGPTSLAQLTALAEQTGKLWLVPPWREAAVLAGQAAVSGDDDVAALVRAVTGRAPGDGLAEIERAHQRAAFLAKPRFEAALDGALRVSFEASGFGCVAAFAPREAGAVCRLVVEDRLWRTETLPSPLPLRLVARTARLDPLASFDAALAGEVEALASRARLELAKRALDDEAGGAARLALLIALKARLDDALDPAVAKRLLDRPLFPCTDGVARSAAQLDDEPSVLFVTRPIEGAPASGRPVVIAVDPDVVLGLERFTRDDVTEPLTVELRARAARRALEPVARIELGRAALVKVRLEGRIEGEVGLAPSADGRLDLLHERRPLCTVPGALPLPLTAEVNCDTLTPVPSHDGVQQDAAFHQLVEDLVAHAAPLGEALAAKWSTVKGEPGALEAALRLCVLLARRKAKPAGKKKRKATPLAPHPLLGLPLLTSASGAALSVQALRDEEAQRGHVLTAERAGTLLGGDARLIWRTDWRQRTWLKDLELKTEDATAELERADRIRARPKVEKPTAPLKSPWRQAVSASDLEGEVALPERPTRQLVVELYQERALLERFETEHAFGGAAAVNCDALSPNDSWTKAARNAQFKAVLAEVERALHQLLARRLSHRDARWREWAANAARWATREGGPVADVLPQLELLEALDGSKVTLGAALAEYSKARRVAVADDGLTAARGLVLKDSPETRELLEAIGVTTKDVTAELLREGELEAERKARRLKQLSWPGEALRRHAVSAPGMSGELALPLGDSNVEVVLAREGISVQALPASVAPGFAGVIDIDDLMVDETWTKATLSVRQREVIITAAHETLEKMCFGVSWASGEAKASTRRYVLTWLQHAGIKSAAQLDRLTGVHATLAGAPVFETAGGEWVGVAVLAAEVRRRGKLAVLARGLFRPDAGGLLAVLTRRLDDDWLDALEQVLGKGSLERVKDASTWREAQREADPPEGSPELWGLKRLRRDVKLLRAGALGQLSPDELEDVRLKAMGGELPVHYDKKRKLVLLDAENAQVVKALAEAKLRRERLYVLLAAMYGAINRALDRVTDEHEERLMAGLRAHLAANPQLLEAEG